jgi:hypothetical protein
LVRFIRIVPVQISDTPFGITEWSTIERTEHEGDSFPEADRRRLLDPDIIIPVVVWLASE